MNAQENNIRLSIIVPVYNAEKYLDDCILSLLNQDLPEYEYEIIFVNDGSTDNSVQVIEKYMENHPCIRLILQANAGVSAARNVGLEHACGKYIWFVDSDDYIATNCLKTLLSILETKELQCLVFVSKTVLKKEYDNNQFALDNASLEIVYDRKENFAPTSTRTEETHGVVFKRAAWRMILDKSFIVTNNILFNENMNFYEDELFTYKCRKLLSSVGYYNNLVYYYRNREESASKSKDEAKRKKHHLSLIKYIDVLQEEIQNLDKEFRVEEKNFLKRKINENSILAFDLLLTISDKEFVLQQLHDVKKIRRYVRVNNSKTSLKRRILNAFSRITPFNNWFWIMWILHGNKRKNKYYEG